MIETTLKIDGMMCEMCESHINLAIRNNLKIKKVSSDYKKGQVTILSEEELPLEMIEKTLEDTGYRILARTSKTVEKQSLFNSIFGKK